MIELLQLIAGLGLAVVTNIALGMWYKIGKQKIAFDWKVMLAGVAKGLILGGSFVSVAYVIELTGVTPDAVPTTIVLAGVALYLGKILIQWKNILGLTSKETKEV